MTITLSPDLEAALKDRARQQGLSAETLALNALRERFATPHPPVRAHDDWEQLVRGAGTDCAVSLPHDALSSEGLYE